MDFLEWLIAKWKAFTGWVADKVERFLHKLAGWLHTVAARLSDPRMRRLVLVIARGVVKLISGDVFTALQQQFAGQAQLSDAQKWQGLAARLSTAPAEETYSMTQDESELLTNQLGDGVLVGEFA
jgi:hypothetical protein